MNDITTSKVSPKPSSKLLWINVCKFIAIFAVLLNHTGNGYCFNSELIYVFSWYCVSLFILLSGITSYLSIHRHGQDQGIKELFRRVKPIIYAYLLADAVYVFGNHHYHFDVATYLVSLVNFTESGPFYFVLFYVQLIIVSPILYRFINFANRQRYSKIHFAIQFCIILFVGAITLKCTYIVHTWGGGGGQYILGSTYLALYYLGMVFCCKVVIVHREIGSLKKEVLKTIGFFIPLALWFTFIYFDRLKIDKHLPFGDGYNPPSISTFLYAILMGLFLWKLLTILEHLKNKQLNRILSFASALGNASLYIFLYHLLVKIIYDAYLLPNASMLTHALVVFPCMLLCPWLGQVVWKKAKALYKEKIW